MTKNKFENQFEALFLNPDQTKTEQWIRLARDLGEAFDEEDSEKIGFSSVSDELLTKFQHVKDIFGTEIAQILYDNIESGGILPCELAEAAKYLQEGGNPGELTQKANSGVFMP